MNMEELLTSNGTQLKIETGYRLLQYRGQSPSVFDINYPSKAGENMTKRMRIFIICNSEVKRTLFVN